MQEKSYEFTKKNIHLEENCHNLREKKLTHFKKKSYIYRKKIKFKNKIKNWQEKKTIKNIVNLKKNVANLQKKPSTFNREKSYIYKIKSHIYEKEHPSGVFKQVNLYF